MGDNPYKAAYIEATVKIDAWRGDPDIDRNHARRTATLEFRENFADDAELDEALDAFTASVKAAARRG